MPRKLVMLLERWNKPKYDRKQEKLTSNEFVSERLGLGDGAQTTSRHLLGVELHRLLGDVEPLLNDGSQLTDSAALLSEHTLCPRSHNDDLRASRGDTHLHTGVAILSKLPGQELVEFRLENSVSDELQIHREVMFWSSHFLMKSPNSHWWCNYHINIKHWWCIILQRNKTQEKHNNPSADDKYSNIH